MATYQLSSSKVVPDMSKGYAYINFPNVNFVGENIVYNYPVESSIYMLDIFSSNSIKYKSRSLISFSIPFFSSKSTLSACKRAYILYKYICYFNELPFMSSREGKCWNY